MGSRKELGSGGVFLFIRQKQQQMQGGNINQVSKRTVEVHQAGLHVVFEAIQEHCAPASYSFANGEVHIREARLAFFMGDQPAHDKHVAEK